MARSILLLVANILAATTLALANVEKTIFLGPAAVQVPTRPPTIDDLELPRLSPNTSTLRTELVSRFPDHGSREGHVTWLLLEGLTFAKRYEVRICWAATQPTEFRLDTYELPEVFGTPDLIASLSEYVSEIQPAKDSRPSLPSIAQALKSPGHDLTGLQSLLLLRISTTADYYSSDKTLMENVPPVLVDIILDPFAFNVLPKSLKKTVVYIVLLAGFSWFVSTYVVNWLVMIAAEDEEKKDV